MSEKRLSSRVTGAVLCYVTFGRSGLPFGVMRGVAAQKGFQRRFPPAVVFALHAREPSVTTAARQALILAFISSAAS